MSVGQARITNPTATAANLMADFHLRDFLTTYEQTDTRVRGLEHLVRLMSSKVVSLY